VRVIVLYRGMVIGTGDLTVAGRLAAGEISGLPGYRAIRPVVRAAERVRCGLEHEPTGDDDVGPAALARLDAFAAVAADLDVRDAGGTPLLAEWIALWDYANGFRLMAELTHLPAATYAARSSRELER
jgi:hypothetical protein